MSMYLVTGSTGNVGRFVVESLLESGKKVRLLVRDPQKVSHWIDRAEVLTGDLANPSTFGDAFSDVIGVFLMNRGPSDHSFRCFVDRAKAEGCSKIVFLSSAAAHNPDLELGRAHKKQEDFIRASGVPASFIRPGGFMSNTYQWIPTIKGQSTIYNPTGLGQFAPVAPEDIAAVVFHVLTSNNTVEEIYDVTGGELLTTAQQAETLSSLLGRQIQCVDISLEAAVDGMVQGGVPRQIAEGVAQSLALVRDGRYSSVTDTVARLTGRRPKTFETWARENLGRFA